MKYRAIPRTEFHKPTALYSLRRVYWRNVFEIKRLGQHPYYPAYGMNSQVLALKEANEWILGHIKGVQQQIENA